jgi:hypothetical protein
MYPTIQWRCCWRHDETWRVSASGLAIVPKAAPGREPHRSRSGLLIWLLVAIFREPDEALYVCSFGKVADDD